MCFDVYDPPKFSEVIFVEQTNDFFDISCTSLSYTRGISLFLGVDMEMIKENNMNVVFQFIRNNLQIYNSEKAEVFYGENLYKGSTIEDTFGKFAFPNIEEDGWLVFINPSKQLNWAHKCDYRFISQNGNQIKQSILEWAPDLIEDMKKFTEW